MRNSDELQYDKILNVLEEIGFTDTELELAEDYMDYENKEILEVISSKNLSKLDYRKQHSCRELFRKLLKNTQEDTFRKVFNIIFTTSGSTTCYVFPMDMINNFKEHPLIIKTIQPYQMVAMYTDSIVWNTYQLCYENFQLLRNLGKEDPEVFRKAIPYNKNDYDNVKLLLMAFYFRIMQDTISGDIKNRTIQDVCKEYYEADPINHPSVEENLKLFQEYIDEILNSIENLFDNKFKKEDLTVLLNFIKDDTKANKDVSQEVKDIIAKNIIGQYLLTLLVECAFVNYQLSPVFQSFIKVFATKSYSNILIIIKKVSPCSVKEEQIDQIREKFKLPLRSVLIWCAGEHMNSYLEKQLESNSEEYINAIQHSNGENKVILLDCLRKFNASLHKKVTSELLEPMQKKIVEKIIPSETSLKIPSENYLYGKDTVDSLYPYYDLLQKTGTYSYRERELILNYAQSVGKDDFFIRANVFMALRRSSYFFNYYNMESMFSSKEKMFVEICNMLDQEHLLVKYQLNVIQLLYNEQYSNENKENVLNAVEPIFIRYLETKEKETLEGFQSSEVVGRYLGLRCMKQQPEKYKKEILAAFQDTSKMVKDELVEIIRNIPSWESDILEKLNAKKAAERETAIRIIGYWNKEEYKERLEQLLEKEKSKKLKELLAKVLQVQEGKLEIGELSLEEYLSEMHRGGKKRSIAWAYEENYPIVHTLDGKEVSEEYMQAILLSYSTMSNVGINKDVIRLTEQLNQQELASYMNEVFERWLSKGAEAKKRWVLYACSIHGGAEIVPKLKQQINYWPTVSRGAIAAEAVKALALNPTPTALLLVDSISRKFKFRQIKSAAGEAIAFAATQLGISKEELSDRIIPDFGFNEEMKRTFDYGPRTFHVYITPTLELEVVDEKGKKRKSLPSPGKKDDPTLANEAFTQFKQIKKQMKIAVATQKARLEYALSVQRIWTVERWTTVFVKNPIMHQFAISLIWGIYDNGQLQQTFRYMEDGTFNSEEEEEIELPQNGQISLVHPIELSKESLETWKEQLDDYEVSQSIEQLNRPIYRVEEENAAVKVCNLFYGEKINGLSLTGKLLSNGWYRTEIEDAGCYQGLYREDSSLGIGAELDVDTLCVGCENEEVTIMELVFYDVKKGRISYYCSDSSKREESLYQLSEVPERYYSEIIYQLAKVIGLNCDK